MKPHIIVKTLIFTAACCLSTPLFAETTRKPQPAFANNPAGESSMQGRTSAQQDKVPCMPQAEIGPGCVKPWDQSPPARVHINPSSKNEQRGR